jgi:hypothetical protein
MPPSVIKPAVGTGRVKQSVRDILQAFGVSLDARPNILSGLRASDHKQGHHKFSFSPDAVVEERIPASNHKLIKSAHKETF